METNSTRIITNQRLGKSLNAIEHVSSAVNLPEDLKNILVSATTDITEQMYKDMKFSKELRAKCTDYKNQVQTYQNQNDQLKKQLLTSSSLIEKNKELQNQLSKTTKSLVSANRKADQLRFEKSTFPPQQTYKPMPTLNKEELSYKYQYETTKSTSFLTKYQTLIILIIFTLLIITISITIYLIWRKHKDDQEIAELKEKLAQLQTTQ